MRENNRNPIERCRKRLPQFTTMNVIDGQAGLVIYSSLIFYSLTIDNILNIIVLLILAGVTISALSGDNGIFTNADAVMFGINNTGLYSQLTLIGLILLVLFIVAGIGQGLLLICLSYKNLGAKTRRELLSGAFLFPMFTVVYCVTMCLGAFSKPKWNKIRRNPITKNNQILIEDSLTKEQLDLLTESENKETDIA